MRIRPFARGFIGIVGVVWLASCTSTSRADPQSSPLTFDDTVMLDNGRVALGVSPGVGRVVHFGLTGGENLIWIASPQVHENPMPGIEGQAYFNLGGDKLWPTSQALWQAATGNPGWPPDGVIDGQSWSIVAQDIESLTMRSPESEAYGVVVTRRFELVDGEPAVMITNTIRRTAANPFPLSIWTITQVVEPRLSVLDIAGDRPTGAPATVPLNDSTAQKTDGRITPRGESGAAVWEQAGPHDAKMGSYGRWVAAVYDEVTFLQTTDYNPFGGYPDASSVQVYRGDPYIELELWSPLAQLAPGAELTNTVRWELLSLPRGKAVAELLRRDPDAGAAADAAVEGVDDGAKP